MKIAFRQSPYFHFISFFELMLPWSESLQILRQNSTAFNRTTDFDLVAAAENRLAASDYWPGG